MKHNLFSRFLGVLLAVVMLASLMSMPSLADTVAGTDTTAISEEQTAGEGDTTGAGSTPATQSETGEEEGQEESADVNTDSELADDTQEPAEGTGDVTDPEDNTDTTQEPTEGTEDTQEPADTTEGTEDVQEPADTTEDTEKDETAGDTQNEGTEQEDTQTGAGTQNSGDDEALPAAFDGAAYYDQLMNAADADSYTALADQLTEEEKNAFVASLTQEQLAALQEKEASLFFTQETDETNDEADQESAFLPPVDFTNVAPFLPAVKGSATSAPMRMAARSYSSLANVPTITDPSTDNPSGLELNKSIKYNSDTKDYTITLESYVTGDITMDSETIPTDIVLVLDQSGSMADCINCGLSKDKHTGRDKDQCPGQTTYTYTEIYANKLNRYSTYYIYSYGEYYEVNYYSGYGSNGWYTNWGQKKTPKTGPNDNNWNHTQFYVRNEQSGTNTTFESRVDALKEAVNTFVTNVQANAVSEDVNHRIAIVGFGSDDRSSYTNSELLTVTDYNGHNVNVQDANKNHDYYREALVPVNEGGSINQKVSDAVDAITANGGTAIDLGVDMAEKVLQANPVSQNEERNQVVVIFTDGVPGIFADNEYGVGGDTDNQRTGYANRALSTTHDLKAAGVSVYTVGVFSGANAEAPVVEKTYGTPDWDDNDTANRFMQYMSSNYKYADNMNDSLTDATNGEDANSGYYLSASNSAALNSIFTQISDNIQSGNAKVELGAEAVVKDVLSDSFKFATDGVSDVTAYTVPAKSVQADQNGTITSVTWSTNPSDRKDIDSSNISVDPTAKTVNVTGFDYKNNFVSATGYAEGNPAGEGTYKGRKLVVEITVEPDYANTIGGNYIPSNTSASGIYANEAAEKATGYYNIPAADVNIQYDFSPVDKTIYIKNEVDLADLFTNDVNGKNNKYVDITYTVKDKESGTTVGVYTIPAGSEIGNWKDDDDSVAPTACTEYTITCEITPKYNECTTDNITIVNYNKDEDAIVHVLVPQVTVQDTKIDLNTKDSLSDNLVKTNGSDFVWVDLKNDGGSEDQAVGDEPTVDVKWAHVNGSDAQFTSNQIGEFDSTEYDLTEDTYFNVNVYLNGATAPLDRDHGEVSITSKPLDHEENCINDYVSNSQKEPDRDFTVHVLAVDGTLIIQKTVSKSAKNGNPVFNFKVTSEDGTAYYYQAKVTSKDAVQATPDGGVSLPAGTYTVEELENLAYSCTNVTGSVDGENHTGSDGKIEIQIKANKTSTVTFTNKGKDNNIPTDNSGVKNDYKEIGKDGVVIWGTPTQAGQGEYNNITTSEDVG